MVERPYERIMVNGVHMGVLQCGTPGQDVPHRTDAINQVPTIRAINCNDGPVLVLIHGFTGSATSWGTLLDDLAARGIQTIALDMLGHGQSDAPDDPQRYSMEHCQADIIGVLQTLGIKEREAILLGYSMGGRIALYCTFSRYFRAVILESASAGITNPVKRGKRRVSDRALAHYIEREGIEAFVGHWEDFPLFASQHDLSDECWNAQRAQRLNNSAHGLANSLRGVGVGVQPVLEWNLGRLTVPVLLITGKLDTEFSTLGQFMFQQSPYPQTQLQIVPDAGHNVHLEQPERFLALVHDFCAKNYQRSNT
jgi:2-succinyl-6-hydroxy-2,4-cyclohexadiene-1-carboxylate synthase